MQTISAIYVVSAGADEIARQAEDIALEQTVEVPRALVTDPALQRDVVGRVAGIEPMPFDGSPRFRVTVHYNAALASDQLPQLLNLIYGNISIKDNIRLVDLALPDELVGRFRGPNVGLDGLRQWLGAYDRPLLATAIKPRGSANEVLARIAGDFALGGGDIVKDDHNLVDDDLDAFRVRVTACQQAVEEANASTGRGCLYLPNVCGRYDDLRRQMDVVTAAGVRGILISPLLVGVDAVRHIAATYPVLVMSHPTFAGTFFHDRRHGITPGILLGTLFRMAGVDATVFPNYGGRFGFTAEECAEIARRMASPLGMLKPGWPAPAGGMQFRNLPDMARHYGQDCIFLVGGALLSHMPSLVDSTRAFAEAAASPFAPRHVPPRRPFVSACELPSSAPAEKPVVHLPKTRAEGDARVVIHLALDRAGGAKPLHWANREPVAYKASAELPFRDVVRHELLGKQGEAMQFDLRYFEINPGGYSSREKHEHTHTIIAARGRGVLTVAGQRYELSPLDVAYVPPSAIHQLVNENPDEPFGFFCIVDRQRDRPTPPDEPA